MGDSRPKKTPEGIRRYLDRKEADCARHLSKSRRQPPEDRNLRGIDMEWACRGCIHRNVELEPYCHVARVEQGIRPIRLPVTSSTHV